MITKKQLNEVYNGIYEFEHTDSYGTRFVLKFFSMGNIILLYVYRGSKLVFHRQSCVYTKFRDAAKCFDGTKKWIVNEKEHKSLHERFGSTEVTDYLCIKREIEEWAVQNKRPMNIADAQALAKHYKNKSKAMDMIYTAACAIAHDPAYSSFSKSNNFSVQFSI